MCCTVSCTGSQREPRVAVETLHPKGRTVMGAKSGADAALGFRIRRRRSWRLQKRSGYHRRPTSIAFYEFKGLSSPVEVIKFRIGFSREGDGMGGLERKWYEFPSGLVCSFSFTLFICLWGLSAFRLNDVLNSTSNLNKRSAHWPLLTLVDPFLSWTLGNETSNTMHFIVLIV